LGRAALAGCAGEAGGAGEAGDAGSLLNVVYDELCDVAEDLMRHERPGHALVPMGLVHEAALRLLRPEGFSGGRGRRWFMGAMVITMRRVLIEHARARHALRRGGRVHRVPLEEVEDRASNTRAAQQVALDDILRQLQSFSRRQSDVVTLRFVHGLGTCEVARQLSVSVSTVERDLRAARAFLRHRLNDAPSGIS
jgi:RNA polymerase sigma factor (TIGR02999 family)